MHDKSEINEVNCVAKQIEDYLSAHPNAADSLGGIVKWWLTRQQFEQQYEIVNKALQILLSKGAVLKSTHAGNTVYVKNNPPKLTENTHDIKNKREPD